MKFVVDENLPPKLAAWLRDQGFEAVHVFDVALDRTPDPRIRNAAAQAGWVIVTKDNDFVRLQRLADGPLLFLTCGNLPRAELMRAVAAEWSELLRRLEAGEHLVETALASATPSTRPSGGRGSERR